MRIVRPLRSGQITIPAAVRKQLGITDESILSLRVEGEELRIKPVHIKDQVKDSGWLKELYDYFAPVRKEAIEKGYTEKQINTAIDKAVKAVRAKHDKSRS